MDSLCGTLVLVTYNFKSIDDPGYKFHIKGIMWLLKLWLNATFESFLKFNITSSLAQQVERRRVEATRLARLTPKDVVLSIAYAFKKYALMFTEHGVFEPSMALFVSRIHGPDCFKREFPPFFLITRLMPLTSG